MGNCISDKAKGYRLPGTIGRCIPGSRSQYRAVGWRRSTVIPWISRTKSNQLSIIAGATGFVVHDYIEGDFVSTVSLQKIESAFRSRHPGVCITESVSLIIWIRRSEVSTVLVDHAVIGRIKSLVGFDPARRH